MSRLYDRVKAGGTRPLSAADLIVRVLETDLRSRAEEVFRQKGLTATPARVEHAVQQIAARMARAQATVAPLGPGQLADMPVVVADNVGRYVAELPVGTKVTDIISVVVPPFRRMFVEVQGARNDFQMHAWGAELSVCYDPDQPNPSSPSDAWVVQATLFVEWEKWKPVGPVAQYIFPLDTAGSMRVGDDGHGTLFGGPVDVGDMDTEAKECFHQGLLRPLSAVLLAVSFMHCKNVDVIDVAPPPALVKKHLREHGVTLARYRVLNIDPMRRVLSRDGHAESTGLRNALHICRGHFKIFVDDAPLFGKYTGSYWWADHVRGDPGHGMVVKDYRIKIEEGGLGREYQVVAEHIELANAAENKGRDPDIGGRGLRAHNLTQNALAEAVRRAGAFPRSPKPEEPQYDLAWDDAMAVWVAEVKSLTAANEEKQLRLALGQVLRYRQLLDAGQRPVKAMIAVERCPRDDRWLDLCAEQGVVLVWCEMFDEALSI